MEVSASPGAGALRFEGGGPKKVTPGFLGGWSDPPSNQGLRSWVGGWVCPPRSTQFRGWVVRGRSAGAAIYGPSGLFFKKISLILRRLRLSRNCQQIPKGSREPSCHAGRSIKHALRLEQHTPSISQTEWRSSLQTPRTSSRHSRFRSTLLSARARVCRHTRGVFFRQIMPPSHPAGQCCLYFEGGRRAR